MSARTNGFINIFDSVRNDVLLLLFCPRSKLSVLCRLTRFSTFPAVFSSVTFRFSDTNVFKIRKRISSIETYTIFTKQMYRIKPFVVIFSLSVWISINHESTNTGPSSDRKQRLVVVFRFRITVGRIQSYVFHCSEPILFVSKTRFTGKPHLPNRKRSTEKSPKITRINLYVNGMFVERGSYAVRRSRRKRLFRGFSSGEVGLGVTFKHQGFLTLNAFR